MTLAEWQNEVDVWIKMHGVRYFDEKTNTIILMEEVGELARLMSRVYGEQSFKKEEDQKLASKNIKEELGDIFFVLTCLCNQMGYDLEEITKGNMSKKTERDKDRHKNNKKLSLE